MRAKYKFRNGETVDIRYDGTFLEEEHPRDEMGKFTNKETLNPNEITEKIKKLKKILQIR